VFQSANGAVAIGLLGGHTSSDVDFVSAGDRASFKGPMVGAYASMMNGSAYIDALVKADFLHADFDIAGESGPGLAIGDDISGLFGEVGGGISSTNAERNASVFAQGNYIFADGYHAGNVKAGARVNWYPRIALPATQGPRLGGAPSLSDRSGFSGLISTCG